ncbi:hypothetical protein J6590_037506 [Homalodisca vitripennis]|nr:hypothetical protein J6590_037506 [Homalodisca vitripennis]
MKRRELSKFTDVREEYMLLFNLDFVLPSEDQYIHRKLVFLVRLLNIVTPPAQLGRRGCTQEPNAAQITATLLT